MSLPPVEPLVRLPPGPVDLSSIPTDSTPGFEGDKEEGEAALAEIGPQLADVQERKAGWSEPFIGPGRAFDTDQYFVICMNIIGGCGGSTGPATIMGLLDRALALPDSPLVCVLLIGPMCGPSFDGHQTENANFLHLLAALQLRRSPRLWVFQLDGAVAQRDHVIEGAAELAFRLAVSREGELDLTRLLRDGFSVSTRRNNGPVLCRVNFAKLATDSLGSRARALDALAEALGVG